MAKSKKANVQGSLESQLVMRGQNTDYVNDMVRDYMALWDIKNKLIEDIGTRGVTYQESTSTGIIQTRNNPSTKELLGVNRQMLQILKDLGLNGEGSAGDPDGAL